MHAAHSHPRALLLAALALGTVTVAARGQNQGGCSQLHFKEAVQPMYPPGQEGRVLEGVVEILADLNAAGRISHTRVLSGPALLRFEAEAYVRGWRTDPGDPQQCAITLNYRFDGSQGTCNSRQEVHIRPEREDGTHVTLHLSCDLW